MNQRDAIVDAALNLAEQSSWEEVRLHAVAAAAGVNLDELRRHFREKEDIAEAWFDRADIAACRSVAREDSSAPRARFKAVLLAWLAALAPHRRPTREMILGRLEPGHVHFQLKGVTRISRTVQLLRDVAGYRTLLPLRALEEVASTGIYLTVFGCWLFDHTPGSARTHGLLNRLLNEPVASC